MPRGYRSYKKTPQVKKENLEDKKIKLYENSSWFADEIFGLTNIFEVLFYSPFLMALIAISAVFETITLPYAITKNMIINSKIKKEAREVAKNDMSFGFDNLSKDKANTTQRAKKYSKAKTFTKNKEKNLGRDL